MKLNTPEILKDVELTKKDCMDLLPYLRSWEILSVYLSHIPVDDIGKLILIELNHKRRWSIVERMISRYSKLMKLKLVEQIKELDLVDHGYVYELLKELDYENQAA